MGMVTQEVSMLSGLKDKLLGGINRVAGNTDFLEAVCASCALVAFLFRIVGSNLAAVLFEPTHRNALPVAQGGPATVASAELSMCW